MAARIEGRAGVVTSVAVLGVAIVMAGVTWVGSTQAGNGPSSDPSDPDVASYSGELEPWAARARTLYASWAGTADEQQAAEVVVAHALNGAYSDCMADKGYPRPWQTSISPASVYEDPLLYSFWAASRLDHYYSQKVINAEIGQRIEHAANSGEAQGDDEAAAELACREENPGTSDDDVTAIRTPAVAGELLKAWAEALAPVLVEGGDIESYDTCIAESGVLDELGVKSTEEARSLLSTPMPVGSVSIGDEPLTPEWESYLANEQAFVEADWECREGRRAGLGQLVEQSLDTFETEHADQIRTARQHWDSILEEATGLGWSPEDPYAGAEIPSAP